MSSKGGGGGGGGGGAKKKHRKKPQNNKKHWAHGLGKVTQTSTTHPPPRAACYTCHRTSISLWPFIAGVPSALAGVLPTV